MVTPRDAEQLIGAAGPPIRDGFLAMIVRVTTRAEVGSITEAIEAGNLEQVWQAVGMQPGDFNDLREAVRSAVRVGGEAEAETHRWTFDMGASRMNGTINGRVGFLIREITDETRELVRERVVRGIAEGTNPRSVALDLVGRRKLGSHSRTGGMIGLTRNQESWVQNALAELSGDEPMGNYLTRQARDRRFDASVRRALREGRPVPAETRAKMIAAYRRRLLQVRGEAIGRTEAVGAVNAGRNEAIDQAVDGGTVTPEEVRRFWLATIGDGRTRETHLAMNNQSRRQGEPFVSPSGAQLMYPGDRSLGAPADEIIGCRCSFSVRIVSAA